MARDGRTGLLNARTFGVVSVVAVIIGLLSVFLGDALVATVGVVLVIVGVISLLLAVGVFLDDTERANPG